MGYVLPLRRRGSGSGRAPGALRSLFRALRSTFVVTCVLLALTLQPAYGESAQAGVRVFLPTVSQPAGPPATIRFGSGLVGGQLIGEAASFTYGRTTLYYEVGVEGAAGQPFSEEWTVSGQRRLELDRSGTLPPAGGPYASGIALSTLVPLPRGTYQLQVRVGGLVSAVGQATIE